nr:xylulose kinase-1 [Tanacetum cinerariifolium]
MERDDNHDGDHPETSNTSPPAMKMEHYLSHTDYSIRQVIQNGNGHVSIITDTNGMIKVLPPKTAEEVVASKRERKVRTTLLMALLEDHLAKFHKMVDAKDMWEAIKSRFSGNDESKKMQKYLLKQQFEGFSVSTSEGLHTGDGFEMAVAMISMRINKFHKKTDRKLQFDTKDPVGFDKTKLECFNCHNIRHFARDCRAKGNQDNRRRDVRYNGNKTKDNGRRLVYQDDSKALVTIDGKDIDWSGHTSADESDSKPSEYVSCESDSKNASKVICEPKVGTDTPIIEEYESDGDNDSVFSVQEDIEKSSFAFTDSVQRVKTSRENIQETCTINHSPKIEKQNRNAHTRKGLRYGFTRKACFGRKNAKSGLTKVDSDKLDVELDKDIEYMDTEEALIDRRLSIVDTARPDYDTARPDVSTARQELSTADDKAKGVAFKDSESTDRLARSILTLKPLPTIDPKDKGKGVLEEPESAKKMSKSDFDAAQIARDEEIARQLEVELQAEEQELIADFVLIRSEEDERMIRDMNKKAEEESSDKDGTEIHMLAERRYLLTTRTLERMLSLKLIDKSASDAVYDLLRFIQKQIDESGGHDRGENDL